MFPKENKTYPNAYSCYSQTSRNLSSLFRPRVRLHPFGQLADVCLMEKHTLFVRAISGFIQRKNKLAKFATPKAAVVQKKRAHCYG